MSYIKSQGKLSWLCLLAVGACGNRDRDFAAESSAGMASASIDRSTIALHGAGATFPYPLYSKWISAYNKLRPNIEVNYQSIGSGGGIRQVIAGTVDFGATDVPMTAEETASASRRVLQIPTSLGAVAVVYHLDGVTVPLRITPETLAAIYLGRIRRWNAPELVTLNPEANLPRSEIAVVYRSEGSGTTAVFTEYLAKISADFSNTVGQGRSIAWPVGLGAKGNEGVSGQVRAIPYSIGYVEHVYAEQNGIPAARLKNAAGNFIEPNLNSIHAAAEGAELTPDSGISIIDARDAQAYPITTFSYLLVHEDLVDQRKGQALAEFIWWAIHDGQRECTALGYAPLPTRIVTAAENRTRALRIGDRKALTVQ